MLQKRSASLFFLLVLLLCIACNKETIEDRADAAKPTILDHLFDKAKDDEIDTLTRLKYTDSLIHLATKENVKRYQYKGIMMKTTLLIKLKEIDNAIYYAHNLKDLAIKNNDTLYIGKAFLKLGMYHKEKNNISESFSYYNQAYINFKAIEDSINVAKALLGMARNQRNIGNYIASKVTAIDGLKSLNDSINNATRSGLYQSMTIALRAEGAFDKALEYNKKAQSIVKAKKKNKNDLIVLKNTEANILGDQGYYDKAITLLDSLRIVTLKHKGKNYARIIDNLGYMLWKQNSTNKQSEGLLKEALSIREQTSNSDVEGLISSNIHLTQFYAQNQPNKALYHAKKAFENAKDINSLIAQQEALDYIISLEDNPKQAALQKSEISKLLQTISNSNSELYALSKYENENLLKENLLIETKNARTEKRNTQYLLGLITAILLATILFIVFRNRHQKEKREKVYETEKRISKRIHDELANEVYNTMVQLENNTVPIPEVVNDLEEIYYKTRDLSHEKFIFKTNDDFIDSLRKSLQAFGDEHTNIIVKGLLAEMWLDVSNEKKVVVYRVIKELLVNMRKHSKANLVSFIFNRDDGIISIKYTDNGLGIQNTSGTEGIGMVNTENRIQSIGGSLIFDTIKTNGVRITISFQV